MDLETYRKIVDGIKKSPGLGTDVKVITTALGVKPCGGCMKRAEMLDKLIPHKRKSG